jgi:uncharacterized cupin superfamily protein
MPKIDAANVKTESGTNYPEPYSRAVEGRSRQRLGNAAGLDQFGVNLTRLKPGAWSAQRHWHDNEDEFVLMLEGEAVLVEDEGETLLKPGDAAGFKAGVANGHCLINRSAGDAVYLEIGTRAKNGRAEYPDIDLKLEWKDRAARFTHRSGEAY